MTVSNTAAPAVIAVEGSRINRSTPNSAYMTLVMILLFDAFASPIVRLALDSGMPPVAIARAVAPRTWDQ